MLCETLIGLREELTRLTMAVVAIRAHSESTWTARLEKATHRAWRRVSEWLEAVVDSVRSGFSSTKSVPASLKATTRQIADRLRHGRQLARRALGRLMPQRGDGAQQLETQPVSDESHI
jgi:hypothetical protein